MEEKHMSRKFTAVLAGALMATTAAGAFAQDTASTGGEAGPIHLRDMGNFYVGAEYSEPDAEGNVFVKNQMHVEFYLPEERQHELPLILVHGGGGQASDWYFTPDGRDGWRDYFLNAGFDLYIVDRPGYGRSPASPEYGEGELTAVPSALIARLAAASNWPEGEVGPETESILNWVVASSTTPYAGNEVAAQNIAELLERVGPAVLLLHSAGGVSGFWAADMQPENVAGIIAFEASGSDMLSIAEGLTCEPALAEGFEPVQNGDGCDVQADDAVSTLPNFADIPVVLIGAPDSFLAEPLPCRLVAMQQAGIDATLVDFGELGAPGTGHFAMAEPNNADSAQVMIDLAAQFAN